VKQLIVTADDFGAATQVNEAVERAHRDGILSAASLMVAGAAAHDAVARAKTMPKLRVGLHLVLVEGKPVLPAKAVPDLVDSSGYFRTDMARAGAAMFFLPKVRAQLAAEIAAQFEAFAATGLALDHVNAHKHFHLHPTIAALMIGSAAAHGVKGARVPLEPQDVLGRIEPRKASAMVALTTPFAKSLRRRFRRAGIAAPDHVFGLAWSGAMTGERLAGLIRHLPEGLSEIYTHPCHRPLSRIGAGLSVSRGTGGSDRPASARPAGRPGGTSGGFADFSRQ
jgi:hopanoid biosynthesis associated protein HpnK